VRVPTSLLPHTVTLAPFEGTSGSQGPVYGAPVTVKARLEGKRRAVRTSTGIDVIGSATAIVRPDVAVAAEDHLVHGEHTYEVLVVTEGEGLRQRAYRELILEGPL
jgi:hypothetical protein